MFWEIWDICVVVFGVCVIINGYIRFKNGPTEKQTAKMENKYNRTLTQDDLTYYKKAIKYSTIACAGAVILVFVSMFL